MNIRGNGDDAVSLQCIAPSLVSQRLPHPGGDRHPQEEAFRLALRNNAQQP